MKGFVKLSESWINLGVVKWVEADHDAPEPKCTVVFVDGGAHTVTGDDATQLMEMIDGLCVA